MRRQAASDMGVVEKPKEAVSENAAPNPLLRAFHLNDANSMILVGVHSMATTPGHMAPPR